MLLYVVMYGQIIYRFFKWLVLSIFQFRTPAPIMNTDDLQQFDEVKSSKLIIIKKAIHFNYKWIVDDFHKNFDSVESPIFSNEKNNYGITWRLKIINTACYSRSEGVDLPHMYVKLCLASSDVNIIQSNCKVQLISGIHKNSITYHKLLQFSSEISSLNCFDKKKREFLNPENGFFDNGKITLTCAINAVIEIPIRHTMPKCTLVDDFESVLQHREFTDFTFCVSGEEFSVHKAIVGARSPVFNAMFNNEMEESKQNRVDISDVDGEVFRELLRFIYTGRVLNLEEYAIDLLPVADKYGLEKLIVLCAEELCASVSSENAAEALILAKLHNLDHLKDAVIAYIGTHAVDVIKTPGWNSLLRSYPDLVGEILCDVSGQLQGVIF